MLNRWIGCIGAVWVLGLGMAALWDVLFYGHPVGLSAGTFAGALLALVLIRSPGLWRSGAGRIAASLAAGAVLALVEEPTALAILVVVAAIGTLVLLAQRDIGRTAERVSDWIFRWILFFIGLWLRILLDNIVVANWLRRHPRQAGRIVAAIVSIALWTLPLLAGTLFIVLFAIANPIIENWLRSSIDELWAILDWLSFLSPVRVAIWGLVAAGTYGLLRHRRLRLKREASRSALPPVPRPDTWLTGQGMIIRCLVVFNAVFAVETLLDALYLLGGAHLPAGMTYAHYAHRGAYPLIFTALLAGAFALAAFKTGGSGHRSVWARRLVYLWIAQNIFLLFSTCWRLELYVEAYSLTRLRLATAIWVLLVAMGFVWIVIRMVRSLPNAWLWKANVLTLGAVLYGCAFVNVPGLIAEFNVWHCHEVTGAGPPIDVAYLESLGPESLPALDDLRAHDQRDRAAIGAAQHHLRGILTIELSDWRGWTYRRWREAPEDLQPGRTAAQ